MKSKIVPQEIEPKSDKYKFLFILNLDLFAKNAAIADPAKTAIKLPILKAIWNTKLLLCKLGFFCARYIPKIKKNITK